LARTLRRRTNDTSTREQKGIVATNINENVALKDPVLEERLHKHEACDGGESQFDDEVFRPYKRRRLSKDSEAKRELIAQLTTEVFGLLGSQVAADLDGLSMVAG
jgi:hypothetical protein